MFRFLTSTGHGYTVGALVRRFAAHADGVMFRGATATGQVVVPDSRRPAHHRGEKVCPAAPNSPAMGHFNKSVGRGVEQRAKSGALLRIIGINKTFATTEG